MITEAHTWIKPEDELPPLRTNAENDNWRECMVKVKLFDPMTNWTWYIYEYDPESNIAFGFVVGHDKELGEFSLNELRELILGHEDGVPVPRIERDLYWDARPLGQVMDEEGVTWHREND